MEIFKIFTGLVLLALLIYIPLITGYFAGYRDGHLKGLSDGAVLDAKMEQVMIQNIKEVLKKENKNAVDTINL